MYFFIENTVKGVCRIEWHIAKRTWQKQMILYKSVWINVYPLKILIFVFLLE